MDHSQSINKRYSALAKLSTCLSCGGAINHADPKHGEVCIDLGSGRGTDAVRLAKSVGGTGYVFGFDIAEGMIETARAAAKSNAVANISFIHSTIEKIDIADSTADLLISNCTINHAKNKLSVWQEVFRALKPGGRFLVSDIYSIDQIPDMYKNDPVAVAECWAGAVTREQYLETLESCGFFPIEIIEESTPYEKGMVVVASFTIRGFKPFDK